MRWISPIVGAQLLCLLDIASAVPHYEGTSKKLSGRQEALLLFKRQTPFCVEGYFQCPAEFGGGCCANGRRCATRDCPAVQPNAVSIPNAVSQPNGNTPPPPPSTEVPVTEAPTTDAASTDTPTLTPATVSSEPTSQPTTEATETTAPQTSRPSDNPSSTRTGTSTATQEAESEETSSNPAEDGTLYTPMGISMGAVVGIAFAGVTGLVIVALVIWRACAVAKKPKRGKGKGKARAIPPDEAAAVAGGATGAGAGGSGGNRRIFDAFKGISLPKFGGKKGGGEASEAMMPRGSTDDQAPMSQTPAAMGFGPQPMGAETAPPYMQDRNSLDRQDTAYNRHPTGGDLGYRSVESFDSDMDTQGLFPRGDRGPGFPDR